MILKPDWLSISLENYLKATHKRRPVELVFFCEFNDIMRAILFEKQVKGWSRKKKEAIINDNWEQLKELSVCKNKSHSDNLEQDQKASTRSA